MGQPGSATMDAAIRFITKYSFEWDEPMKHQQAVVHHIK
jgi:hypothetical protein